MTRIIMNLPLIINGQFVLIRVFFQRKILDLYFLQNSSYKRNFVEDIYEVSIICKSSINFLNG